MALPVTRSVTSEKGLGVGLGVVVGQSIGAHHIGERDCPYVENSGWEGVMTVGAGATNDSVPFSNLLVLYGKSPPPNYPGNCGIALAWKANIKMAAMLKTI